MPKIHKAQNDIDRVAMLSASVEAGTKDHEENNVFISSDLLSKTKTFIEIFKPVVIGLNEKLKLRVKKVARKNQAIKFVEIYTRDIWSGLKRRVARENQPAYVLEFYKLSLNGTNPKIASPKALLEVAGQVVQGDADAVEAGFETMTNPTAAELKEKLETATEDVSSAAQADQEHDNLQAQVSKLRPQAESLIDDLQAELRFFLRKLDPPSRRQIMRTYGIQFRYSKREARDPDDVEVVENV